MVSLTDDLLILEAVHKNTGDKIYMRRRAWTPSRPLDQGDVQKVADQDADQDVAPESRKLDFIPNDPKPDSLASTRCATFSGTKGLEESTEMPLDDEESWGSWSAVGVATSWSS